MTGNDMPEGLEQAFPVGVQFLADIFDAVTPMVDACGQYRDRLIREVGVPVDIADQMLPAFHQWLYITLSEQMKKDA